MKDKHTFPRQRHLTFGWVAQDERCTQPPNFSPELALPSLLTFLLLPRQIKPFSRSQPSWKMHLQPVQGSRGCANSSHVSVFGGEEEGPVKHTCFALPVLISSQAQRLGRRRNYSNADYNSKIHPPLLMQNVTPFLCLQDVLLLPPN